MGDLNAQMTLIAHFVWSYCTNLLQLLVGIHFADHVCFSQWIVVSVLHLSILFVLIALNDLNFFCVSKILGNKCPLCRTVLFISPRTCAVRCVTYMLILFVISCISVIRKKALFSMSFALALVSCQAAEVNGFYLVHLGGLSNE